MQYFYNHSMNGWSQATTGVEFNCKAATQGVHHVIHLVSQMPPPSEWRASQAYDLLADADFQDIFLIVTA